LRFIVSTYRTGLRAPEYADLNSHFIKLFRCIVHHASDHLPCSANYLREIAESFQDCQAVQARAIERVGLRITGVESDFAGMLTRVVGDYKSMAVTLHAEECIVRDGLRMDATHYVSRLNADLGASLGLNSDDIRRGGLDEIANRRLPRLDAAQRAFAGARVRELFDLKALLGGLVAEVGSRDIGSVESALPRSFLDWASGRLSDPHRVLDEETSSRGCIDQTFVLVMLEDVFLGAPRSCLDSEFNGVAIGALFDKCAKEHSLQPASSLLPFSSRACRILRLLLLGTAVATTFSRLSATWSAFIGVL